MTSNETQTKVCTKCKVEKPLSEFHKSSSPGHTLGVHCWCKPCKTASMPYYSKDESVREHDKMIRKNRKDAYIQAAQIYVRAYLETHPCVDCGEDDWIVLEFDHVRREKYQAGRRKMGVAQLACDGYKLETIIAEIEKCDVRCRNCHARVTYQRQDGCWRNAELEMIDA